MAAGRFETACEIARALDAGEVFSVKMPASPRQDIVDFWWSAHSAGRMLDIEVEVHTSDPIAHGADQAHVVIQVRATVNAPVPA